MISETFIILFGKTINALAFTTTIPFRFDFHKNLMKVSNSKFQNRGINVWTATTLAYSIFSAYRLITEIESYAEDYIGLLVVCVWSLVYLWTFILQLCHKAKQYEMAWMFNEIVARDRHFGKQTNRLKSSRLLDIMVGFHAYMGLIAVVIWSAVFYFASQKKGYLFSLVNEEQRNSSFTFAAFLGFEIISKFQACSTILWDLLYFETTTIVSSHWIDKILSQHHSFRVKIRDYKCFYILSSYMNASNSTFKFSIILWILFVLLCFGIYGGVALAGKLDIFTYMVFPMLLNNCGALSFLILLLASKQYKLSSINLDRIRRFKDTKAIPNKQIRREMKSLREFGVSTGILEVVKYPYVAQFILALSNTSLSLLVAFPNAN